MFFHTKKYVEQSRVHMIIKVEHQPINLSIFPRGTMGIFHIYLYPEKTQKMNIFSPKKLHRSLAKSVTDVTDSANTPLVVTGKSMNYTVSFKGKLLVSHKQLYINQLQL